MTEVLKHAMSSEMLSALEYFGWRDDLLNAKEEDHLREHGYLILRDAISPNDLHAMRAAFDRITAFDRRADDQLMDLLNKDPVFLRCLENPRMLHAIGIVLSWDFKMHSIHSRNPTAETGGQILHFDWPVGIPHRVAAPDEHLLCNSAWLLDDMHADNGPTRFVPGSHRLGKAPSSEMSDLTHPHPREIQVTAPAGSVLIFNGHLWHSGTPNRSGAARRVVFTAFERRDLPQPADEVQRDIIRVQTLARLSSAHRYLVDV